MFHSAKSVKERDVMRQRFLEKKGWIIERIWSRSWWKNPGLEIDRIDARIRELAGRREAQDYTTQDETVKTNIPGA